MLPQFRAAGLNVQTYGLLASGFASGVDALDSQILGQDPLMRYKGGDASGAGWNAWTYGSNLVFTSDGTNPDYNDGSPLMGSANDDAVFCNGGDYFDHAAAGEPALSTNDFVFEAVVMRGGDNLDVFSTISGGGSAGFRLRTNNTGFRLYLDDGTNTANIDSAALSEYAWYHLLIFVSKTSGFAQYYINGLPASAAIAVSAVTGSLTSATVLAVGAKPNGTGNYDAGVAYLAVYGGSGMLASHLNPDLAASRYAKLMGIWPDKKAPAAPTVQTRASRAYSYKTDGSSVRTQYPVGDNWIRVVSREDAGATLRKGVLLEQSETNQLTYSEDCTNVAWTKVTAGDTVTGDTAVAPDNRTVADSLIDDGTSAGHGVTQPTATLSAVNHTFSVWAKEVGQGWLYLQNATVANADCYFNLNTGALGTKGAGASAAHIEAWGNSWYRCGITFLGTAAAHTVHVQSADSDGGAVFAGATTTNTYVYGAQVEAYEYMSSYVQTVASVVTRAVDALRYAVDGGQVKNNKKGSLHCKALIEDYNSAVGDYLALSDGGSAAERIALRMGGTDNRNVKVQAAPTSTNITVQGTTTTATSDVFDSLIAQWDTADYDFLVNGVSEDTDTTAGKEAPDDLDRLDLGSIEDGVVLAPLVLSEIAIYPYEQGV